MDICTYQVIRVNLIKSNNFYQIKSEMRNVSHRVRLVRPSVRSFVRSFDRSCFRPSYTLGRFFFTL